jgi:hypothetical protein
MNTKTSRRAVPAEAVAARQTGDADPIFAAIERHKAAFRLSQEKGRIRSSTVDAPWADEYDPVLVHAAETADVEAICAAEAAANALTTIQPTTMDGLLALLQHVEAFNAGAYCLEPKHWQSAPIFWPEHDLFGYLVLANVRRALEAMAVRA